MTVETKEGFLHALAMLSGRPIVRPDDLLRSLDLDSLGRIELAVLVENEFGSRVLQDRSYDWQQATVADLVERARQTRRTPTFRFAETGLAR